MFGGTICLELARRCVGGSGTVIGMAVVVAAWWHSSGKAFISR